MKCRPNRGEEFMPGVKIRNLLVKQVLLFLLFSEVMSLALVVQRHWD